MLGVTMAGLGLTYLNWRWPSLEMRSLICHFGARLLCSFGVSRIETKGRNLRLLYEPTRDETPSCNPRTYAPDWEGSVVPRSS
jgi:hypothetical protein